MMRFIKSVCALMICNITHAQVIDDSVKVDDNTRYFHFEKPVIKDDASLIFILHGSGGNGKGAMQTATALAAIAQKENIMLVYPDGYKNFWNECRKTAETPPNKEDINEEDFFKKMISYFQERYHIDTKKVFVVGTSGGGHMAYKLAMTIPQSITAITAIVANLPDSANMDCIGSGKAVPVMIINGTKDGVNPYQGGEVTAPGMRLGTVRSTEATFAYWAGLAGYTGAPVKKILPDTDPADGKRIESYTYQTKGKPEVVLLKVIGGGHDYPGDINVYIAAWEFFKRQMGNR